MTKPPVLPVILHYGGNDRLTGRGPWYRVNCPFHGDRHASASLNEEEQAFVCHACEIKGDAYAIVMRQEGVDFATAKQRVQAITGVRHESVSDGPGKRLAASRLPAWTRNRPSGNRRLSSRGGRRDHS